MKFKQKRFLSASADSGGLDTGQTEQAQTVQQGEEQHETENAAAEAATETEAAASPPLSAEEISKQVDDKVADALKKATMSEAEKTEYEQKQREEALDKKEQELLHRELKANTTKLLAQSGLSVDIADIVLGADMKQTVQNIKKFKEVLDGEVQKQVAERLKGKIPVSGNADTTAGDSVKTQFLKGLNGV